MKQGCSQDYCFAFPNYWLGIYAKILQLTHLLFVVKLYEKN